MSQQSPQTPDWRRQPGARRRRRAQPEAPAPAASAGAPSPGDTDAAVTPVAAEPAVSRTLFSYLEPGLDTVASFGLPLAVAGVVALVTAIVLLAFVGSLKLYAYIVLAIGIALLGVVASVSLSAIISAFISRTGRYGVNSLIMTAAFLGIIVVVGFVSYENHKRIDVTANQQFSLANNTRNLLDNLDQPVKVTAFYTSDYQQDPELIIRRTKVEQTLREFKIRTSKFTYEFKDPDLEPEIARQYGITKYESVVVEGGNSKLTDIVQRTDPDYSQLEQQMYTAILVATGKERKKVYFLSGHGERNYFTSLGDGYASLRAGLERDNYQPDLLSWDSSDESISVPEDAALLVIGGPTGELPAAHAQALDKYLQGRNADDTPRREGGRIIFLGEPDTHETFRLFLARWGVNLLPGYIRDLERSVPGEGQEKTIRLSVFNPQAPPEIIIPTGEPLQTVFMPGAAAMTLTDDGLRLAIPLGVTSINSYLITDPQRTEPITGDTPQADQQGPFVPAALVKAVRPVGAPLPSSAAGLSESDIASLVVFGDADFVSNSFYGRGSGADLFLNSANYLLGDYSLVSIRPKALDFRELNLDKNEHNFVRFSSWFLLPGLLGMAAALVWWVRR